MLVTLCDDRASWRFESPRAGEYEVWLDWACDNATAGQALVIRQGDASLTVEVAGTGSWDVYRRSKVGALHLASGPCRLDVTSAGPLKGPLIDLRTVELHPIREPSR